MTIYALLDGPSAAGAYRFDIHPGEVTDVTAAATLYFRNRVEQMGVSPLSSMFYFGENAMHKPSDFRSEVHDSDGLLLLPAGGAYIWRPLVNPQDKRISQIHCDSPSAFGLFQRDRDFENHQDVNAAYHLRPSACSLTLRGVRSSVAVGGHWRESVSTPFCPFCWRQSTCFGLPFSC